MRKTILGLLQKHFTLFLLCFLSIPFFASAQSYVSTYAGDGVAGLINGDTSVARFKSPCSISLDNSGNLIIADQTNNCIRKISSAGIVSTLAGSGPPGYIDGPDSIARFAGPLNACVDNAGNVFVSDFLNQRIRKIDVSGYVTTIAGNGVAGYKDTTALEASFNYPRGICIDLAGNLFIADSWNHRIRKLDLNGNVTTFAGGGDSIGVQSIGSYVDGNDTAARFFTPCGLSIDTAGNLFLADAYNHRIRMITPAGVVTTVAGSGASGDTTGGFADGAANTARFNTPTEVYVDKNENLYVGDTYNERVRLISNGMVSTLAGNGTGGYVDGNSSSAEFSHPRGLVIDSSGTHIYVSDGLNKVIRKITLNMTIGINETATINDVIVFPNPSTGKIFLSGNMQQCELHVGDPSGREFLIKNLFAYSGILDLSFLPDGMYVLSFYSGQKILKSLKMAIVH